MNNQISNLFLKAVKEVFTEIGFIETEVETSNTPSGPSELIATIGFTGDLQGYIILRSTKKSAQHFIQKMLINFGMDNSEKAFGQFHKEAMGEILNQISGRSTMLLSAEGIHCDITPPTIVMGQELFVNIVDAHVTANYNLRGSFGSFFVFISFKNLQEYKEKS